MNKKINSLFSLLIAGLVLVSCSNEKKETTAGSTTNSDSAKIYVRKNANSPEAKADLEAMNIALQKMRAMDCSNPASWYYQGSIHWLPDTIKNNQLCASYSNMSQLKLAWDNCTHADGEDSDFNFLIWHRFYILHFEDIVRELSGYKDFALPYWDYTDTTDLKLNRTMPLPVRTSGNSLFEQSRFDSLNQGYMISGQPITDALDITELMQKSYYEDFNNTINQAPHGAMHNYIGAGNYGQMMWNPIYQDSVDSEGNVLGGLMANVPSAGYDPIFWMHHSNIDRLWQQWMNMDQSHLVDSAKVVAHPWPYTFFNAKGDTIQYTMEQVAAQMYKMNYRYTGLGTPLLASANKSTVQSAKLAPATTDTIQTMKVAKKINIQNKSLVHSISLKPEKTEMLRKIQSDVAKKTKLKVTVSFKKEPKNAYQVYLNLPKGVAPNVKSVYFVGFMNFFGATHHASHSKENKIANGLVQKTFYFDVSDEVKDAKVIDQKALNISIFLSGGNKEEGITVESFTLYSN